MKGARRHEKQVPIGGALETPFSLRVGEILEEGDVCIHFCMLQIKEEGSRWSSNRRSMRRVDKVAYGAVLSKPIDATLLFPNLLFYLLLNITFSSMDMSL